MRKPLLMLMCGLLAAGMAPLDVANANVMYDFTLHFDNLDLDLGLASQIDIDNQYLSTWGVRFHKVYRYIDDRDPFADPGQLPDGSNFGISNGNLTDGGVAATKGQIHFEFGNTSYFTFDWATLGATSMYVKAYNAAGDLQDDFFYDGAAGPGFGTHTLTGDIANVIFHDAGHTVAVANMSYETAIPEPGTLGLLGMGLAGLAAASRRRKRNR